MIPIWFDTHCHVDELAPGALAAARRAGVGAWVCPGVRGVSKRARALAAREPGVAYLVGVHPTNLDAWGSQTLIELEEAIRRDPRCLGVGEVGLDFHRAPSQPERARQRRCLEAQLALAARLEVPVSVHLRKGFADFMAIAKRYPGVRYVMHAYAGSAEFARELLAALPAVYFSFAAPAVGSGARRGPTALAAVPHARLLLESDAPYMEHALGPPAALPRLGGRLAEICGIEAGELARIVTRNAEGVFDWQVVSTG